MDVRNTMLDATLPLTTSEYIEWGNPGTARDGATLVISRENRHDEDRLRKDIRQSFDDKARLVDDVGAVSDVGAGITWMVPRESVDAAVRTLHAIVVPAEGPPVP